MDDCAMVYRISVSLFNLLTSEWEFFVHTSLQINNSHSLVFGKWTDVQQYTNINYTYIWQTLTITGSSLTPNTIWKSLFVRNSNNMIETSAASSCWHLEHIEPEQQTESRSSDFKYHHHHHKHNHNHRRYRHRLRHHFHRVKIVSLSSTFLIQLFVATTIMASSSNPSVSMNILNDHIHVHNADIRSVERSMRSQSIDSPKIFLNENRPLPRTVGEKYRNMKIPFISTRPIATMTKFTVNQNQSSRHTSPPPPPPPSPPAPLSSPFQSDPAIACYCPYHKLKCMRLCSNEKKYTKKSHKRTPYDRQKMPKLHVKSSTIVFGGGGGGGGGSSGFLRNSNASQSIQRRNHAFASSNSEMLTTKFYEKEHIRTPTNDAFHKNRTIRSNAYPIRNHNHYMLGTQSPSMIAFDPHRNSRKNVKMIHASPSNQMDITEMLWSIVNADESMAASAMNANSTKHNVNDRKRYKIGNVKRRARSILPLRSDASTLTPNQRVVNTNGTNKGQTTHTNATSREIIGSTFGIPHLNNNTWTMPNSKCVYIYTKRFD